MTNEQRALKEKLLKDAMSFTCVQPYVENEIYTPYVNAKVASAIAINKSRDLPQQAKEWLVGYAKGELDSDFGDLSFDDIKDVAFKFATEYVNTFNARRRREIEKIDAELGLKSEDDTDTCDWINLCADKAFSKKYDELMKR